ncbi:unnamed protein product [Gulo gulo]|uniref:Uncharacterized protein n=1 Tax=Gulo gulo TaxID=48420 RepID=A0A9X9M3C3_GULGU|nr:unnamed protein product [Gulo gulo]
MALTRSEVAWARMRACRTISPERTGHSQVLLAFSCLGFSELCPDSSRDLPSDSFSLLLYKMRTLY